MANALSYPHVDTILVTLTLI